MMRQNSRLSIRLNCLMLLTAYTFRLSGQTAATSNGDSIEFIQRAPQSAQAAEELESSLKENPDNRVGHIRLMGYYWAQNTFFNRTDVRHKLIEQAEWFATNEPQSAVFDLSDFNLKASDFPARSSSELARYRTEWNAAVQSNPDDTVVLLHAIRALEAVDTTTPIYCYKRLRVLMPTYPQFALRLANGYMKMINAQWPTSGDKSPAMAELMKMNDSAVIGLTGQLIYAESRLNGDTPEPIGVLGLNLLKKALELDPGNRRWSDALSSPPPSSISSVVQTVGTMRQEDLWPGGKIKGIEAKEGTLIIAPANQAAKLVSPSANMIKNSLAGPPGPGEVKLTALIGPDGQVQQLQFDSGSVRHLPSAMGMVKDWQYSPTMVDGKAVSVLTHIHLTYTAAGAQKASAADVAGASTSSGGGGSKNNEVAKSGKASAKAVPNATPGAVIVPAPVTEVKSNADGGVNGAVKAVAKAIGTSTPDDATLGTTKTGKKTDAGKDAMSHVETSTVSDFKMAAKDTAGADPKSNVEGDRLLKATATNTVQRPLVVADSPVATKMTTVEPSDTEVEHRRNAVSLSVLLARDGTVKEARVVSGPVKLRQAAIKEMKGRSYPPYRVNGEPVEVDSTAVVRFPAGVTPAVDLTFLGPVAQKQVVANVAPVNDASASHSARAAAPKIAQLPPDVLASLIVSSTSSVHPQVARAIRDDAIVCLKVLISTSGKVKDVTVISGPGSLRQAAIDEVKGRTYRPYAVEGEPVEVQSTTSVSFDPAAGQRKDSAAMAAKKDSIILSQR